MFFILGKKKKGIEALMLYIIFFTFQKPRFAIRKIDKPKKKATKKQKPQNKQKTPVKEAK